MSQRDYSMSFNFPTSWQNGRGLAGKTGSILKDLGCKSTLVVTDKVLVDIGVLKPVFSSLDEAGIKYSVNDDVTIEPTVSLFESMLDKLDLSYENCSYTQLVKLVQPDDTPAYDTLGRLAKHRIAPMRIEPRENLVKYYMSVTGNEG